MLTTLYGRTTKRSLLIDDTNINNGVIYENVVAQELKAHKFYLYYYNSKNLESWILSLNTREEYYL
ncbi:MAG: hypothetical protein GX903_07445 [Spirochaetales bacterium]|nr:hypothetical protein [Spirochaetales bacterium]